MNSISSYVSRILEDNPLKMILSKPVSKNEPYKKNIMENKGDYYQLSKYTEKQVFHENIWLLFIYLKSFRFYEEVPFKQEPDCHTIM